jgi:1,2-phenylacetyl-CoA epoxidase PaaB subunit
VLQIRRLGGVVSEVGELKAGRERMAMMTWREAVTRTKER